MKLTFSQYRALIALALRSNIRPRTLYHKCKGMIGGDGCILVPYCGMWAGIETNGYTHS